MGTRTRHYPALDGLRGLAALAVVIYHLGLTNRVNLAPNAYLAVEFFFALSGFVLARAYAERLDRSLSLWGFLLIRLIRVMPLIVLADAIAAAVFFSYYPGGHSRWLLAVVLGALNIPLLAAQEFQGARFVFPLNPPQYSLFFELAANVVWAPLHRRKIVVAALCMLSFVLVVTLGGTGGDQVSGFWSGFPRVGGLFLLGVLLSEAEPKLPAWTNRIWSTALFATLAFSVWFFFLGPDNDWTWYPWSLLIVPVLVVAGARVRLPDGVIRGCRTAGDLSYPLYALQGPLVWCCAWVLNYFALRNPVLRIGFSLAVTALLSAAALKFVDTPVRAWLTHRLKAANRT
jgi:peptidoglycan/LPS O-acetylase OafA/YrhL